jgi:uncharacterized membrane protein YhaH (DUF805 family)
MSFFEAIKSGFNNCFDFSNRATRPEYWYFTLFYVLCDLAGELFFSFSEPTLGSAAKIALFLWLILLLVLMVPHIAVAVRRLHDTNHSGWWYGSMLISGAAATIASRREALIAPLLAVIAFVLVLISLLWLVTRGTEGDNKYGPAKGPIPVSV